MGNSKLKTALAFTKHLATTGAINETNENIEHEITSFVSIDKPQVIVEFGTGHGNITRKILDKMSPESTLYTFEINEDFCVHVAEEIEDTRMKIINAGAEDLHKFVEVPIDLIVSSIPFTFFSKEKAFHILQTSYEQMKSTGRFCQVLYSKLHIKKFEKVFDHVQVNKVKAIPPGYIHHCVKK